MPPQNSWTRWLVNEREGRRLPGPSLWASISTGAWADRAQAAEAHILAPLAQSCVTLGKLLTSLSLCFLVYKVRLIKVSTLE